MALTADDELHLGVALAVALANCEDLPGARVELEKVRPLLPHDSAVAAAMFHTGAGISTDDRNDAIAIIKLALAKAESGRLALQCAGQCSPDARVGVAGEDDAEGLHRRRVSVRGPGECGY